MTDWLLYEMTVAAFAYGIAQARVRDAPVLVFWAWIVGLVVLPILGVGLREFVGAP